MSRAIQCRGKDKVLELFDNRKVEAWSIWQGPQFLFKGIGADSLENMLDTLLSGANAIYTLKVYEDIDDEKKIKSKTPDDGSFNFRLHTEPGTSFEAPAYVWDRRMGIQKEIEELKEQNRLLMEKLSQIESDDDDEEEDDEPDNSINGIINGIIADPNKAKPWIEMIDRLMGVIGARQQQQPQQRSIAGIPQYQNNLQPMSQQQTPPATQETDIFSDEEKMTRIYNALQKISKVDPEIVEHLEKLGEMAEQKPNKFKGILAWL